MYQFLFAIEHQRLIWQRSRTSFQLDFEDQWLWKRSVSDAISDLFLFPLLRSHPWNDIILCKRK